MTSVESCIIVLQHDIDEQYQYQPGEIVRGFVKITLSKPTKIRTVGIKVNGEGSVNWTDDYMDVFQAQEIYVDSVKSVVDCAGKEPLQLEPGPHEFPFDYILPENIPSSYIGKHGNVTYTMKANITGVNSKDNAICSEPFLVLRRHLLPEGFETPIFMSSEKRLWAGCSFGKLSMSIKLDRSGGVPGEDIFLQAEVKNSSRRTVTAMQGSLVMSSVFRAQKHQVEFRQVISKKRDEFDITYNEGRRWNFARLALPPYIPESRLECCDIIELEYLFQFRVELSGGAEIKLETPFYVGATPQGLEIPEDNRAGEQINRQWTVRARGMMGIDEPPVDYDTGMAEWGIENVPEYRGDKAVTVNPLFGQHSFKENGVKVMPDEFVENTRL